MFIVVHPPSKVPTCFASPTTTSPSGVLYGILNNKMDWQAKLIVTFVWGIIIF
jgi:hypothetical protein